jgi:hypothetical protein
MENPNAAIPVQVELMLRPEDSIGKDACSTILRATGCKYIHAFRSKSNTIADIVVKRHLHGARTFVEAKVARVVTTVRADRKAPDHHWKASKWNVSNTNVLMLIMTLYPAVGANDINELLAEERGRFPRPTLFASTDPIVQLLGMAHVLVVRSDDPKIKDMKRDKDGRIDFQVQAFGGYGKWRDNVFEVPLQDNGTLSPNLLLRLTELIQ